MCVEMHLSTVVLRDFDYVVQKLFWKYSTSHNNTITENRDDSNEEQTKRALRTPLLNYAATLSLYYKFLSFCTLIGDLHLFEHNCPKNYLPKQLRMFRKSLSQSILHKFNFLVESTYTLAPCSLFAGSITERERGYLVFRSVKVKNPSDLPSMLISTNSPQTNLRTIDHFGVNNSTSITS